MPLLRQLGACCLGVGLTVASLGTTPTVGSTTLAAGSAVDRVERAAAAAAPCAGRPEPRRSSARVARQEHRTAGADRTTDRRRAGCRPA